MSLKIGFVFFALTISVYGCANLRTVHRNLALGDSTSANAVAIDGYQLPIFSHMVNVRPDGTQVDGNGNKKVFVVCPNPPVEAITASSLAAAVTNSFKAGQASSLGPGGAMDTQASIASAMTAASIGLRTNSTTLLSYNATSNCLAYMGGATQDRKFMELARRNQQITLAILAIEQLTGVAQAGQASLNSDSGSSTGAMDLSPLQTALDNRLKEEIAARGSLATAESNTRSARGNVSSKADELAKAQDALKKLIDGKKPDDEIAAQRTVVESSEQALATARKEMETAKLAEATARQDASRTGTNVRHAQIALELAEGNVRAQASATAAVGQGQGPRASATADVARAVVDIVKTVTSAIGTGETCASLRDTFIAGDDKQLKRLTGEGGIALLQACAIAEGSNGDLLANLKPLDDQVYGVAPPLATAADASVPRSSSARASSSSRAIAPTRSIASPTSPADQIKSEAFRSFSQQSYEGLARDLKKQQDKDEKKE